jgi:hypothetical protein
MCHEDPLELPLSSSTLSEDHPRDPLLAQGDQQRPAFTTTSVHKQPALAAASVHTDSIYSNQLFAKVCNHFLPIGNYFVASDEPNHYVPIYG